MKAASLGLATLLYFGTGALPKVCAQAASANFDELSSRATAALQSDPKAAVDLYKQALALRPAWAEGWFYLAAGLYEIAHYPESRQAFQQAAKLAPDHGAVWSFLGLCEYQLGDYAQALSDIRKGESLGLPDNPQFVSTVRNRAALIFLRSFDFGAAVEQLQPLARVGDNSPETIENLGISALGLRHLPADLPAGKRPIVQLAGRAMWALSAQRAEDASSLFHELITQYSQEPGVHYLNGIYLLTLDPDAALAEFRQELKISPGHIPARLQIGILEIKANRPENAIKLAGEAVEAEPANVLAHAVLGRAFLDVGQLDKAVPELESAAKLAPENPQMHFYLEQAYRRAGRNADAQKEKLEFTRLRAAQDPLVLPDPGSANRASSPTTVVR